MPTLNHPQAIAIYAVFYGGLIGIGLLVAQLAGVDVVSGIRSNPLIAAGVAVVFLYGICFGDPGENDYTATTE